MALTVTKTTNNWTDGGVLSGWQVHRYVVAADDNETYGYEDFFSALGAHADFTYTTPTPDNADNTNPTRTFNIGWVPSGNQAGIIFIEFPLEHEFTETSQVNWGNNIWCGLMNSEPTAIDVSGSNLADWSISWPTDKTGSHVIRQGYVDWRFPASFGGTSECRAVDNGEPTKNASAARIQSSLGMIGPANGQSFEALDGRLYITSVSPGQRQDFDFVGNGQINVETCTLRGTNNGLGWMHYANSHPLTSVNWRYAKHDGGSFNPGQARADGGITADPEVFSTFPTESTHQYLNKTVRQSSAFSALRVGDILSNPLQKYLPSFVGANRQTNGAPSGVVIQGVPGAAYGYAQQLGGNNDWIFLDPSWRMDTDNGTPANWTASNGRGYDAVIFRSNTINNNNAAGVAKTSRGYVIGNQASASTRAYRATGMQSIVPTIRTSANGGTWTVRDVNTANGRGVHYLHDCTKHQAADGQQSIHWTRLTDSDNESWIMHRGGIHRYSENVSLRSTPWNATSLGSTGRVTNNNVDDIPGFSDNMINLWAPGVTGDQGIACTNTTAIANSTTSVTLSGFTNLTDEEVSNFAGGLITLDAALANPRDIVSATRLNDSEATITFTSGGASFAANSSLFLRQQGYEWAFDPSDNGTFDFEATTNKTITYTALAACIQAKLEVVARRKLDQLGNENATFNNTQDVYWAGGSSTVVVNTMLASFLPSSGDGSYVTPNAARAGSLSLLRMGVLSAGSNTLTLAPDQHTHLNFGSAFTVDSSVTFSGSYTDANGTPSFVTLNVPSGVDVDSDLSVSVIVETDHRVDTELPAGAISAGNNTFDTLTALGAGEWTALIKNADNSLSGLGSLPTTWNWATGAGEQLAIAVQGNLTSTQRDTIRGWAGDTSITEKYIRIDISDTSFVNYAVYPVLDTEGQITGNTVGLRLGDPVVTDGTPQATQRISFGVNSSGANLIPYGAAEWQVTAHPTIQTAGSERFVRVEASQGPGALHNDDQVWYFAVTGNKTLDFRQQYTGAVSVTETLNTDPLLPSGTSSSNGTMDIVPYNSTSTTTGTEVTVDTDMYPRTYINTTNRLGVRFTGYDNNGSSANLRLDYLDAKVDTTYSDFVARYGTNGGQSSANTTAGVEITNEVYRIVVPTTSRAEFLFMDGSLPDKTAYYVNLTSGQDVFFGAPTYDPSLVRIEVEGVVNPVEARLEADLDRLAANQVRLSRGIPPRSTVSS